MLASRALLGQQPFKNPNPPAPFPSLFPPRPPLYLVSVVPLLFLQNLEACQLLAFSLSCLRPSIACTFMCFCQLSGAELALIVHAPS